MLKKSFLYLLILLAIFPNWNLMAATRGENERNVIPVYDHVTFYDGYRMNDNPDNDLKDGILRHTCSLYSTKLTDEQLDAIGESLGLNVYVTACCDNYDRIGNINLAFVPKGEETYNPDETDRIEIGRFITPFMDKNKEPSTVEYTYDIDYVSLILRDKEIRNNYDLWLEYEIFGVPYAANQQIKGCEGRSDVFEGTLEFVTDQPAGESEGNVLIPIVIKKPEYKGNNLNNYNESATDKLGETIKTYTFTVPKDVEDAQIVLITSNHGANANGEEYNRRWHYIYYDDDLVMTYKPGRESCEPFRKRNTQANGIYGKYEKTDAQWQSFSNWCPGDVIDNRIISLGAVKEGEHSITISVPEAVFNEKQGDIPVSIYFLGVEEGSLPEVAELDTPLAEKTSFRLNLKDGMMSFECDEEIQSIDLYSVKGERLFHQWTNQPLNVKNYEPGIYVVCVELNNGISVANKIAL